MEVLKKFWWAILLGLFVVIAIVRSTRKRAAMLKRLAKARRTRLRNIRANKQTSKNVNDARLRNLAKARAARKKNQKA
jgi:hypothetical protein